MRIGCDFCQENGYIEDEYGEWKLRAVKLTPLPPIILSGPPDLVPPEADPPYYAMFLCDIDKGAGKGEEASFPIKYCPMCGRSLEAPKKPLTPDEWIRRERERRKTPEYAEQQRKKLEAEKRRDVFFQIFLHIFQPEYR